jgi:hypothetical protein
MRKHLRALRVLKILPVMWKAGSLVMAQNLVCGGRTDNAN